MEIEDFVVAIATEEGVMEIEDFVVAIATEEGVMEIEDLLVTIATEVGIMKIEDFVVAIATEVGVMDFVVAIATEVGSYGPSNTSSYGGPGGGYGNRGPSTSEPTSPEELAQVIREDMETWTESQMWPFSCYSCQREGRCVPRFVDTSPEELRWKAYQAMQDPAAQTAYHAELSSLHEQAMSARRELMAITPIIVQSLLSGDGGTASSSAISPSALFQTPQEQPSIFGAVTDGSSKRSPFASSPDAPASLFAGPSGTSNTANGSLAQGSLSIAEQPTIPEASSTQQSTITVSSTVTTAHQLTEEELKAFKAEHFHWGRFPKLHPLQN
ncbi:hypothetical protein GBAR_LOCUS30366 [Geodia barretti]|uniref:Uncharacterized protein n=2 Tax=Geodia barretti TaxID=519541 RepID=A0AA35TXM1_GEOBA|nr:hypothetical protein GBAR_LOCUS30366 [Geodia barretti]